MLGVGVKRVFRNDGAGDSRSTGGFFAVSFRINDGKGGVDVSVNGVDSNSVVDKSAVDDFCHAAEVGDSGNGNVEICIVVIFKFVSAEVKPNILERAVFQIQVSFVDNQSVRVTVAVAVFRSEAEIAGERYARQAQSAVVDNVEVVQFDVVR